jgi:serine/threonine-protein kinase HipA
MQDVKNPEEKILAVYLHEEQVGTLQQLPPKGNMTFTYLSTAKIPLSVGLPLPKPGETPQPFSEAQTEAYFGGLLPEGEEARIKIRREYNLKTKNEFALLKVIGGDCAGAVSLYPLNQSPSPLSAEAHILEGRILTEEELEGRIKALPQKPLFLGGTDLRLSLAGAQDKAAVCLINNQIAFPTNGCPTTHILKPLSSNYDGMVHNEYFCMRVAKRVGLDVPHVEIRYAGGQPYYLIERYDRKIETNQQGKKLVRRLHQEDFCQALGIVTSDKYEEHGGPTLTQCFELLMNTRQPVINRNRLMQQVIFNFLIGNMDAHGKNFSMMYPSGINPFRNTGELTPAYDLISSIVYQNLSNKMAMSIGGEFEWEKITPQHWKAQCRDMKYSFSGLIQLIQKQSQMILKEMDMEKLDMEKNGNAHPILDKMISCCTQHISAVEKGMTLIEGFER